MTKLEKVVFKLLTGMVVFVVGFIIFSVIALIINLAALGSILN